MRKKSIMVVEDELIVAEDLTHWLTSLGYTVGERVANGRDAVLRCEATRPDLVVMDILLPGEIDGIQAADEIHHRFDIPVVYVTASSDEATLARAKLTQPFGYVLKPFDERGLFSTIEMALYKHQSEKQLRESEERFRLLFENAPVPFQSLDADGHLLRVNKAWLELFGFAQDEVIGRWFGELLVPSSVDRFVANVTQFRHSPATDTVVLDVVRKDGSVKTGAFKGNIAVDQRGLYEMTQCILETQQHIVNSPVGAARHDPDRAPAVPVTTWLGDAGVSADPTGRILGVTPSLETLTGWAPEELCGTSLGERLMSAEDGKRLLQRFEHPSMLTPQPLRLRVKGGGQKDVHVSSIAFRGLGNNPESLCLILKLR